MRARSADSFSGPVVRIYIMAVACSGKTTFARRHSRVGSLRIVDFSPINRRAKKRPAVGARIAPGETYYERIFAYLARQTRPVCVLGRRGPGDPRSHPDVTFGAVLLPEAQHERNSARRKVDDPDSRWADYSQVIVAREVFRRYVEEHRIPLFESFEAALADLGAPFVDSSGSR